MNEETLTNPSRPSVAIPLPQSPAVIAPPGSMAAPSAAVTAVASSSAALASPAPPESAPASGSAGPPHFTDDQLRERILDACKSVYDPEIPVNIFELGLIYDVIIDDKRDVKVIMTLTSPACPSAQELPLEVRGRVAVIPGVNDVDVDVVFEPPWTPAKMSEAAKVQLGFDL